MNKILALTKAEAEQNDCRGIWIKFITKYLFNWVGTQGGLYIENKDNRYGWVIFFREKICKNQKKGFKNFWGVFSLRSLVP